MENEKGADLYKVVRALGGDVNAKIREHLGVDGGLVKDPVELVEFDIFIQKMHRLGAEYKQREETAKRLVMAEGIRENLKDIETDLSRLAVMYGHMQNQMIDAERLMKGILGAISMEEVSSIFEAGIVTLITGRMGSGKTDFAMYLADIARRRGYRILTNIILLEETDNIAKVTKASDLFRELANEGSFVTILDEAGLFANSKQIKKKENLELVKMILVIRKLGSSVIFINQRDMETAKTLRYLTKYEFHKKSKKEVVVLGEWGPGEVYMHSMPPASIKYDTRAIAYFDIDIDVEALFRELSDMTYKDAMKRLREIASKDFEGFRKEEQGKGAVEKKPKKIDAIKVIAEAHPDWSTSKLASVVGVSDRYVRSLKEAGKI